MTKKNKLNRISWMHCRPLLHLILYNTRLDYKAHQPLNAFKPSYLHTTMHNVKLIYISETYPQINVRHLFPAIHRKID